MARGKRKDRLAEEIKKIVSNAFLLKVRDPRLKMAINITAVDVSPDGRNAKVYYVVFSGSDKDEVAAALKKVEPLIRKEIAENMRARYVPNICFAYDTSLEYSRHIESILHDIKDKRSYNDSLIDIYNEMMSSESLIFLPHENVDGDALGSSVAVCLAARKTGIKSYVLLSEELPYNLKFIANDANDFCREQLLPTGSGDGITDDICVTELPQGFEVKTAVWLDHNQVSRSAMGEELFRIADTKICIDHHKTAERFGDYCYIDSKAAATGEIVYDMFVTASVDIDKHMANAALLAITTDTGSFKYSNVTPDTHKRAAELMLLGADPCYIANNVFASVKFEEMKLSSLALENTQIHAGGKIAITFVSRDMIEKAGASDDMTSPIVDKLRSIENVEIAIMVREHINGYTKVSMRSKSFADVAKVAEKFGGGGHIRASGFVTDDTFENIKDSLIKEAGAALG